MSKQNIQHMWSLICQKALIDKDSNLLTLVDAFENLTIGMIENSPFNGKDIVNIPFNCEIVSFFRRTKGNLEINIELLFKIIAPNGKDVGNFPARFTIAPNVKNFRSKVKMDALPIMGEGEYKLLISQKENDRYRQVAELFFDIVIDKNVNISPIKK